MFKQLVILTAVLSLFSCDKKMNPEDSQLTVAGLRSGPNHLRWNYTKAELSQTDLESYYYFIYRFGKAVKEGKCSSFKSCINNPEANPFYYNMPREFTMESEQLAGMYPDLEFEYEIDTNTGARVIKQSSHPIYADCGDLPKMLEGFHAFMKNLPFGIASFPVIKYPAREFLKVMKRRIPSSNVLDEVTKSLFMIKVDELTAAYEADVKNGEALYEQIKLVVDEFNTRTGEAFDQFVVTDLTWRQLAFDNALKYEKEYKKARANAMLKIDNRYTAYGNKLQYRNRLIKNGDNVLAVFQMISNSLSTSSFRLDHHDDLYGDVATFKDFYPVDMSRESLPPGSIFYDPNGHVWVVFHVDADGVVHMIDAHPDDSITYKKSTDIIEKVNSVFPTKYGSGFQALRPWRVARNGQYMEGTPNAVLNHYSLVQSYGTENYDPRPETFSSNISLLENGVESADLYQYSRRKLARKTFQIDVVSDFRDQMNGLCTAFKERVEAVSKAQSAGLNREDHPILLPSNIYQTEGEWENFSSPGRDARIRSSIRSVITTMTQAKQLLLDGHREMIYQGENIFGDLLNIYNEVASSCTDSYINSNNHNVYLNLDQFIDRIYDISFDPYHCPELRWGAKGQELSSCPEARNWNEKMEWYQAQSSLRRVIDRDTSIDFSMPLNLFSRFNEEQQSSLQSVNLDIASVLRNGSSRHQYINNRKMSDGYVKPEESYYGNTGDGNGGSVVVIRPNDHNNGGSIIWQRQLYVDKISCEANYYGNGRAALAIDFGPAISQEYSWHEVATYKNQRDCNEQLQRAREVLKNDTICVGYGGGSREAYLLYNFKRFEFYGTVKNGRRQIQSFNNVRSCERMAKSL